MTSSTSKLKSLLSNGLLMEPSTVCNYCREKGHMVKDCEKLQKKNEKGAQKVKPTHKKTFPECGTCGKKITLRNNFGKVQGRKSSLNVLGLKPHRIAIGNQKKRFKKLILPRLQHHHLVSVRQNVRSDPPTKIFHEYQQQLMQYPFVVWQQQMEKATLIT